MDSIKPLLLLFALLLISIFGFIACNSGANSTGQLSVSMTDAPADYEEVNVTIESIRVHREEDAETDAEEAEENGWITILDEPITVNLLNLRNGNEIPLGNVELESGEYSQMRFILGSDNTIVVNGETFNLKTPSGQQSGVKLNIDAEIEEDQTYSLLVDFDAGQSVVETDNGMYVLKPVLRAVNVTEAGKITGTIQPTGFQTYVYAATNDDTLSTYTEDEGEFEINALAPGTYNVTFQPNSDQYQDSTITGVEVTADKETELGTITLENSSTI